MPTGAQNLAESAVDFVQDGIILQTMGAEGLGWTPFLLTLFSFILVLNIWEVMPGFQMPVTAHIAIPVELALLVWVLFNFVGIKSQGFFGYFKSMAFPPGVPWPLYILITPIEIISTLFVRPLSLSVRLFANMLAGHLLLATFAVLTAGILFAAPPLLRSVRCCRSACSSPSPASRCWSRSCRPSSSPSSPPCTSAGAMHPEH